MKIAITGTIGSGKTEVSNIIRKKGYFVFDCDEYNRQLLKEGSCVYDLIKERFPNAFKDGQLNKETLSNIVFNESEQRKQLENILHPLIIKEMMDLSEKYDLFFAEVPLLFENSLNNLFDVSVLVVCDREIALDRLVLRGISKDEAILRINNQMSIENKMLRADEIIYNNDTLALLEAKIDVLINKYVR